MRETKIFTVICRWRPRSHAREQWQLIAVTIAGYFDGQEAADNAGLYLIWNRQGEAEPWLVLEGTQDLYIPHGGTFDAEYYDDTITFIGQIISECQLAA